MDRQTDTFLFFLSVQRAPDEKPRNVSLAEEPFRHIN